jgi:hypothetical protein
MARFMNDSQFKLIPIVTTRHAFPVAIREG